VRHRRAVYDRDLLGVLVAHYPGNFVAILGLEIHLLVAVEDDFGGIENGFNDE
jgi:hypothetical protein